VFYAFLPPDELSGHADYKKMRDGYVAMEKIYTALWEEFDVMRTQMTRLTAKQTVVPASSVVPMHVEPELVGTPQVVDLLTTTGKEKTARTKETGAKNADAQKKANRMDNLVTGLLVQKNAPPSPPQQQESKKRKPAPIEEPTQKRRKQEQEDSEPESDKKDEYQEKGFFYKKIKNSKTCKIIFKKKWSRRIIVLHLLVVVLNSNPASPSNPRLLLQRNLVLLLKLVEVKK